ncbi:hypothetical protein JCM15908A_07620 [Prevotella dentasini JCM 15908]
MKVRKATAADLDTVLRLIENGRKKMKASGNLHQWTDGHPGRECIENDIRRGNSYLLLPETDDPAPVATFAFILGKEPTYAHIEQGDWLNTEPYGVVHRVASADGTRGVVAEITRFCARHTDNIRIDTHADNLPMQKALSRLGYILCGVIHLDDGAPRLAYQLITSMTEREKQAAGLPYLACDPEVLADLKPCEEECFQLNRLSPLLTEERTKRLRRLLGKTGSNFKIIAPFFCDYGYNIEVGEDFFANTNMVILDEAKVTFGDNVYIAPNCSFYTAGHPLNVVQRNADIGYALPIRIGNNVWIGGNVVVLPGVTIGDNTTIGAGSVVTHDIPGNVVAAGNPCRVIREIKP